MTARTWLLHLNDARRLRPHPPLVATRTTTTSHSPPAEYRSLA